MDDEATGFDLADLRARLTGLDFTPAEVARLESAAVELLATARAHTDVTARQIEEMAARLGLLEAQRAVADDGRAELARVVGDAVAVLCGPHAYQALSWWQYGLDRDSRGLPPEVVHGVLALEALEGLARDLAEEPCLTTSRSACPRCRPSWWRSAP